MATKKQLIANREATFRKFDYEQTCWKCRYAWFHGIGRHSLSGTCQAIEIRGEFAIKEVTPADSCELFQEMRKIE